MNNLTKKFNKLFFIYITFIFITAVFWLYEKHNVGNDSTISEWIINYQGGFTRRGIIGEICYHIATFFDLSLRFVIFLSQSFLYLIYSILIYFFIKNTPKNALTIIAIFSPVFLLYPLAESEVLARKEIFLYVGFIIFLNLSTLKYSKNIPLIYIFFIFPVLCLIYEPFIFFFSYAIFIILIQNSADSLKKIILKILLCFSSSFVVLILIPLNPITTDNHLLMANSLLNNFGEICYMSCAALGERTSVGVQFYYVYTKVTFEVIFRYSIILLLGFLPLLILFFNSQLKKELNFQKSSIFKWIISKNFLFIFFILFIPSFILFSAMGDWGRVVNMSYTFPILTFIYLIKNNLITINNKVFIIDDFFLNKKKIFIILFIIFAFGWNQKTALTADVSTNSLYKIIYNTSKRVFHFDGIRLFQESPIIKFHKKYVE